MTISAKIIADSISTQGIRITTFELEYPRFIHAEFMTHRLFSRNAASSRAIPVEKTIELIRNNPAMPIHWGKNQPGMSAKEECTNVLENVGYIHNLSMLTASAPNAWRIACYNSIVIAEQFRQAGYHKQIVNRLLEPFSHIKVVCTATEFDNFFNLRRHPDAQPEIQELANQMYEARSKAVPVHLDAGDCHVPYWHDGYWSPNSLLASKEEGVTRIDGHTLGNALVISASCCAQVSYRKTDESLEKAQKIYTQLVQSKPIHASPFEHQATPMRYVENEIGVTHKNLIDGSLWSGNFRGWIQHRQLIEDHTCWEYK